MDRIAARFVISSPLELAAPMNWPSVRSLTYSVPEALLPALAVGVIVTVMVAHWPGFR